MRRYLLGNLSEQEREHIEQLLMSDDGLYEQLLFAEDDLIDEYIFGTLPDEDRSKFKQRFLRIPELRESVNFTAALRKHALQTAPQLVVGEVVPSRPSLLDQLRKFFMQPAAAVAFGGLLLGAVGLNAWLFRQNSQLRNRVGQLESQQTAPPRSDLEEQLRRAEQRNQELSAELARQGQIPAEASPTPQLVQEQPKEQTSSPSPPVETAVFAIAMTSGAVRDSGEETKRVILPANTVRVRFNLDLAPGDYQSYSAVLQTLEGQRKWSKGNLKFTTGNIVAFEVPAKVLAPGDYEIVLTGVKSSGTSAVVRRFYFRI